MFRKIFIFLILITMIGCSNTTDPTTQETTTPLTPTTEQIRIVFKLNPGIDTVEVNTEFIDAGAYAFLDDEDFPVDVISNNVDITKVGTYKIIYQTTYDDEIYEIIRYVDVIDETPPTITLNPGIDTIVIHSKWKDAGVTVSDNSGLEVTVEVIGNVLTYFASDYEIIYTATDAYGNESTVTRYVNVLEENDNE